MRSVTFPIFLQQIICDKLLLILIWTYHLNYYFSLVLANNKQPLRIYCENIIVAFLSFNFLFFILFFSFSFIHTFIYIFFPLFFSSTHVFFTISLSSLLTFLLLFFSTRLPFLLYLPEHTKSQNLSLFLSLSLTHSHTHTHTQRSPTNDKGRETTF